MCQMENYWRGTIGTNVSNRQLRRVTIGTIVSNRLLLRVTIGTIVSNRQLLKSYYLEQMCQIDYY